MTEEHGFDLLAAGLRADHRDIRGFLDALATKLEGALPGHCDVERGWRGLRVTVRLGNRRFLLHRRRRHLVAELESIVHDMRRTRAEVTLDEWLGALEAELRKEAASSAEARAALDRLLNS